MACFRPLKAFQLAGGGISFSERGDVYRQLQLPCGQCVGCRLERSRQWAVRCMHEASLYDRNCFVTLTYDDEHVPPHSSLRYSDFQKFLKRVRRRFSSARVRFYMCGEYGESFGRPHFHACLFNFDFDDKVYLCRSPGGSPVYRSAVLETLWTFGFSSIGEVNFQSAAYVARYVMKKVTGQMAAAHYERVDAETGEIVKRCPEFNKMSLKPGIGAAWLAKYRSDVYPHGRVVVNGHEANPPRYYDKLWKREDALAYEDLEYAKFLRGQERYADSLPHRLEAREKVARAKVGLLKRSLA